jgi:hypothetical protein
MLPGATRRAWEDEDGVYRTAPWLDDFGHVPPAMHDEFAAAAREHAKVVEINLDAMVLTPCYPEAFKQQYLDYLAGLQAAGVSLSIGSDCHDEHYAPDLCAAAEKLAAVGLREDKLWRLPERKDAHD